MPTQVNEADWKLFRKKLPGWQEAHMDSLNRKYAALLAGPGSAADIFWELEKQINADKHHVGVVAELSRSKMDHNILSLLAEGAISLEDLSVFSEDLQSKMAFIVERHF